MSVQTSAIAMSAGAQLRERGVDGSSLSASHPSPQENLMDKWKAHYQKRKTYKPGVHPYLLRYGLPIWFLGAICSGYVVGAFYVTPFLYENSGPLVNLLSFCLQTLMLAEILINWYFVKTVTSFYPPRSERSIENGADDAAVLGEPVSLGPANNFVKLDKEKKKYLVCVQMKNDASGIKRELFLYWGPRPCPVCKRTRPPRAHHCPICNGCILKRDHHCYFTGSCVGLRNQRHFIMLAAWSFVTLLYAFIHAIIYIPYFVEDISYWDLNIVIALIRFVLGYVSCYQILELFIMYSIVVIGVLSGGFLREQAVIIRKGLSQFEYGYDLKVINTNSTARNIKSVFGDNWALNLLFPAHWLFPNDIEDGITWPGVKVVNPDLTELYSLNPNPGTAI